VLIVAGTFNSAQREKPCRPYLRIGLRRSVKVVKMVNKGFASAIPLVAWDGDRLGEADS